MFVRRSEDRIQYHKMGKRYYCDYCDRTLPYSVDARKKHNSGHQHRLAKRIYYDSLKSAREHYKEELEKPRCKRFFSGQYCAYGESCIYSHVTEADLEILRKKADDDARAELPSQLRTGKEPSLEEMKAKLEKKFPSSADRIKGIIKDYCKPSPFLKDYGPLPPSLQPPQFEDFIGVGYDTWG